MARQHAESAEPMEDPRSTVYFTRPYRPLAQLAVRVGLWMAVGIGCLGGLAALLVLPHRQAERVVVGAANDQAQGAEVPAPVAGTAELAVDEWLTATEDDRDRLDDLFVEPVALRPADADGGQVSVQRLTTVAGHAIQDGYWVVTVRAELAERVDDAAPSAANWFVEVGVVGDVSGGLAALSTPSVMPAPPRIAAGWQSSRPALHRPSDGDPIVATVEGFLDALLAGQGDPSRYVATGTVIPAASPPPFVDVAIEQIAVEEQDDGDMQVWVDVRATSPAGRDQPASYQLVLAPRADRWEIAVLWGAPSIGRAPSAGD
jgi:hypothetical protein